MKTGPGSARRLSRRAALQALYSADVREHATATPDSPLAALDALEEHFELAPGARAFAEELVKGVAAGLHADTRVVRTRQVVGHQPGRSTQKGERASQHAPIADGHQFRHANPVGLLQNVEGIAAFPVRQCQQGRSPDVLGKYGHWLGGMSGHSDPPEKASPEAPEYEAMRRRDGSRCAGV